MEQLYMLEIMVEKIRFAPSVYEIPQLQELKFGIVFAHLVNSDLYLDDIRDFKIDQDLFQRNINLNLGKSITFSCKPADLLSIINQYPLDINLKTVTKIGSVSIPWGPNFVEMIGKSSLNSIVSPASARNTYELLDESQIKAADLDLLIRLSSYGENIQTEFQMVPPNPTFDEDRVGHRYFFKDVNGSTVFRAQTFNDDSDPCGIPMVAALCGPADSKTFLQKGELEPVELSIDELHKILCSNKNCPGAQQFAEFGIGPAATGTGLGTLYHTSDSTDFPISYGLSNTYGVMQNYGPFGLYLKPKGFSDEKNESTNDSDCALEPSIITTKSNNCVCCPLRLRGGGSDNDENVRPQPFLICKDLMQSFDKVLEAYKKALGPCGQSTCPFSYNILDESCKKFCKGASGSVDTTEMLVADIPRTDPNSLSVCGTRKCPFNRTQSVTVEKSSLQNQLKKACGKPTCPFAKQKMDSATEEEIPQMQFNEQDFQSYASKRAHSSLKTQSLSVKPLEPIHWDCPDPLPKGPCRNSQCPYKPKELRYTPKGPCGSTECPYATFPACGEQNCPFSTPPPSSCKVPINPPCQMPVCPPNPCAVNVIYCSNAGCLPTCSDPKWPTKPCPIIMQCQPPCQLPPCQEPSCQVPPCKKPSCQPPSCQQPQPSCQLSQCQQVPCQLSPCQLPLCQQPPCQLPPCQLPPCPPTSSICSNPNCPFVPANKCDNPNCPFKQHSITTCLDDTGDIGSICKNPQCIYAKRNSLDNNDSYCSNTNCPNRPQARKKIVCSNLQCPYQKVEEKASICFNPNCPFQKSSPNDIESVCSNRSCPYRKPDRNDENASICDNPDCPYQKTDGIESICGNPDCPYGKAPESESICFNPDCPFRKPEDNVSGSICLNIDCPIRNAEQNAAICLNPYCLFPNVCSNPDCPFQQSSGDSFVRCTNPYCPHALQMQNVVSQDVDSVSEQFPNAPPSSQDQPRLVTKKPKRRKCKRKPNRFKYKIEDLYPGIHIGHRACIIPGRSVPAKMGWAWNVYVPCLGLKPMRGWRPGAVARTVAKMIMAHRTAKGLEPIAPSTPKSKKSKRGDGDSDVTVAPKPTLLVKKRDGAYEITMNPLKDPYKIEENENPYMDCSPLQFKISKDKDESRMCFCDEPEESSSDSELDIEFTPPAGIIRPEKRKKKAIMADNDTQYNAADFAPHEYTTPGKGEKRKDGKGRKGKKKGIR